MDCREEANKLAGWIMALIQNYGLFWRRSRLGEIWPRSGSLLGVGVKQKRVGLVDFAKQRGIYALYDDNFRLVYVGQAGRQQRGLYGRLRSHTRGNIAERWTRFSWFGLLPVDFEGTSEPFGLSPSVDDLNVSIVTAMDHIEAVLIRVAEPLRNASTGSWGAGVVQYRQAISGQSIESQMPEDGDEL